MNTQSLVKQVIRNSRSITRRNVSPIDKAIERNARKVCKRIVRPALSALLATVNREIEPVLELARETDRMIASGLIRLPSLDRQLPVPPANASHARPALPLGLPMPSNKVINPAFAV